jgi:hypothetical protein
MPDLDSATELAVGDSMVTNETEALRVETIRAEEHLFTTVYEDAETGEVRLALQVDVTTGRTAIDPRRIDTSFWTLVADGTQRPMSDLKRALRRRADPTIEVKPEAREIHVRADDE